jgi:SP family myo-inositol transporter-like MFS transporter 13
MGLYKDAEDVLSSIRSPTHLIQDELEDIRISCNNISSQTSNQSQENFFSNLLSDRHARRSVFLGCLLQFCQQLAGINTVMYYAASIVKMTGASDDLAVWFSCVTAGINFIFSLVGLKLVNLLSRRKLLFISCCCVIFSLLSISASFQYLQFSSSSNHSVFIREVDDSKEKENHENLVPSLTGEIIVLISIALYIASFAPGLGPLPWTINSELHPAWCRAKAQGLATSVNWMANLMVSMTFLSLVSALGRPLTFLLYAAVTILCSAVLAYQLPETTGVSLEEVGALFCPSASTPRSGDVLYSLMSPSDEDSQNER